MPLDQQDEPFSQRHDEARMSFGEHLEELRMRLIRALVGIGICAILTFAFGFQLIGRHLDEAGLCRAGHAYQGATDWHERHPPLG